MSDVVIRITLDAGELQRGLSAIETELKGVSSKPVDIETAPAENKLKSLRDSVAMWGLAIQGAVNTFKMVGQAMNSVIQPALEAERGLNRVKTAVESTGMAAGYSVDELAAKAGELQAAFSFDDDAIMNELFTPLLTFTNIAGPAFDGATQAIMDMNRALGEEGGGLKNVSIQVGKALNDPILGISALTRVGVSFSEQQKEQIKQLAEMGDVAGAQQFILEELNKEFGGQAAAYADSYGGKIERMKLAMGDLAQSIGEILLPVLTLLANAIRPLIEWFTGLDGIIKVLIITLPLATAAWYKLIAAKVMAATVSGTLSAAITAASVAVKGFLVSIGPVGWVLLGATAAVTGYAIATSGAKKETEGMSEAQKGLDESTAHVREEMGRQLTEFDMLVARYRELKTATSNTAGEKRELQGVIRELNAKFGEHVGNIDLETSAWNDVNTELIEARNNLIAYYTAKAIQERTSNMGAQIAGMRLGLEQTINRYADQLMIEPLEALDPGFMQKAEQILRTWSDRFYQNARPEWLNNVINEYNKVNDLHRQFYESQSDYAKAMQILFIVPKKSGAPGTASDLARGERAAVKGEYERLSEELARIHQTDTEVLNAEYEARKAIIVRNTTAGSATQIEQLKLLGDWRSIEQAKIDAKQTVANEQMVADLDGYYNEVKFLDAGYYDWKRAKIAEEVALMGLSAEQAKVIADERLKALDEERAAYERLPVEALMQKYLQFKAEMADTKTIGVAAWAAIRDGLIALKTELEGFAEIPGVKEVLEKLQGEIEIAQLNAGSKKGNWFWHGLIGFDPDDPEDTAKIGRLQDSFNGLMGSFGRVTSGLLTLSNQRRDAELERIDEVADREQWTDEQRAEAKADTTKKFEAEERRLKNIQKNLSIVQAVINTSEAVTKALTLGPILGPFFAAGIATLGAIEIATIRAQKFARGGLFRGLGGPRDDQNLVAISDGEFIVNAAATRRFLPLLQAVNEASGASTSSSDGGGSYSFAGGGMVAGGGVNGLLEKLIEKVEILNLNLVKKDMSVSNTVRISSDELVRATDRSRTRMERRGYVPAASI